MAPHRNRFIAFKNYQMSSLIKSGLQSPEPEFFMWPQVTLLCSQDADHWHIPFRPVAFMKAMWMKFLSNFVFSKLHQKKGIFFFRKRHTCASSKDAACCWGGVDCQTLSGALVVKKKVLVLAEQAEFQASAAASSNKKCPDAHDHHDYIRWHQIYSIMRT